MLHYIGMNAVYMYNFLTMHRNGRDSINVLHHTDEYVQYVQLQISIYIHIYIMWSRE